MKTYILSAKSIWLIHVMRMNPKGRSLNRIIAPLLKQWYSFEEPKEFDEQKGVEFRGGEFAPSEDSPNKIGVILTIYNDGVVVQTSTSTDDADAFIEQLAKRLAREGIIEFSPDIVWAKQYSSEIEIRAEGSLLHLPKLERFYKALADAVYPSQPGASFVPVAMAFDVDIATVPRKQIAFKLERRAGFPFSHNLYYSHAPVHTKQHLELLTLLGECLKS